MKESQFNTEIVNSLLEAGAWAHKISDTPGVFARFAPEKPCDIFGGWKRLFFMIESKQMKKFEAININHFRYNQIKSMDEAVAKGNPAFAFINVRIKGKKGPVVDGKWTGANYENRLIILDWATWGPRLKQESLKAKEIRAMPFEVGAKGIFPMTNFFKRLEGYGQE